MTARDRQKEQRRDEILLAALALFVKHGYASTKTSDIAKAARMSDGLLFHYFATKEKLYEALVQAGMDASQEWTAHSAGSPLLFFEQVAKQVFCMLREDPQRANYFVLMAQALRSGTTPAGVLRILEAQSSRYATTVELIRRGQRLGEIRSGDPDALAYAFWCSIQGIAEQLATAPQTPFPEAEWIVSILKNPAGAR